ncbi:MAG: helix-turn-helix domain-containing protein [Phenylobacterium sp.]|uniref:AraC family transcriptional regulator n=1 Tax=Phenylobacterium sp. TaxID=1871053 RepID=UPI001A4C23E0|nr:AraC family transcriptional regulator [Phenylobacterium sp.]MBL8772413.1 helix-turn-helix domain-containing protein [Phenylobacterium sp.]
MSAQDAQALTHADPVPGMTVRDIRLLLSADTDAGSDAFLATHLGPRPGDDVIAADACWRLFSEHAARVGDETHRVFAAPLRPGGTALLVSRMLLAGTLGEALRACADALPIMIPDLSLTVAASRRGVCVRWRCAGPPSAARQVSLEATAVAYHAIFSWLAGAPIQARRVRAPGGRASSGSPLLRLLRAPVAHAGDDLEIVLPADILAAPVAPRPVEAWYEGAYRMICEALLQTGRSEGFADLARSAVLKGADQQALADRWGVSTKTVARRLEQEGASFRRIRDAVRREKSASLIHAGLTLEEIGDLLGYEDPRSFRRAFRRWFGVSPSAYRARPAAA